MREYVTEPRIDVFDPRHNARQIAKELTLLEDHLRHPPQHCPDCVRKHILKAEAYADEAVSLDTGGKLSDDFDRAGAALRSLSREYGSANKHTVQARREMAQEARKIRKRMGKMGFVSQTAKPRRVQMRPAHFRKARPVSLMGQDRMGASPLATVGTPGWDSYPNVVAGGPFDFTINYRPGRTVVTQEGATPTDPLPGPYLFRPLGWFGGKLIGPGVGDAACQGLNATNDYQVMSTVDGDPGGSGLDVAFVTRLTEHTGELRTPSENCNVVLPRSTVPLPFSPIWEDVFPPSLQNGVWTWYSESGAPVQTNRALMAPGYGDTWGGPRYLMTRLIQGVVANKTPVFTARIGWSRTRQGSVDKNAAIARLYSIAFITIGACTSTLMPNFEGGILLSDGDTVSATGQPFAYPGRAGLIPLPDALYPPIDPAYPDYKPKEDPIVSILLAYSEATRDHTDPSSPYSTFMSPLVERYLRREEATTHEWVYAVARSLGFSAAEAKRFEYSAKDVWGIAAPDAVVLDPRNGGGVSELSTTGGDYGEEKRILREIDSIYRSSHRQSERGDVEQTNALWGAKSTLERNAQQLPPMVQRDAEASGYALEPIPGSTEPALECTPTICTINLMALYRGWPSNAPFSSSRPVGARTAPLLPLADSPDARALIEQNYAALMTIGKYMGDQEAYIRAWYWAMILNDPCKEADALRKVQQLIPGSRQAQAADARLSELRPELVRMCPDTGGFPVGVVLGGLAGFGLWYAIKNRKEQ